MPFPGFPEYRVWRGALTSFGSAADGKHVKKSGFVLQATDDGGVWDTLSADTYRLYKRAGDVEIRQVDDSGEAVDISAYTDYQEMGNQAFRVTYTVTDNGSETTYTNEALTLYEMVEYPGGGVEEDLLVESADVGIGAITSKRIDTNIQSDNFSSGSAGWKIWRTTGNAEFNDLVARGTIYASAGEIAHWNIGTVDAYTISADSGKVRLNSQTPYISLGAAVSAYMTGAGIWMGKDSSLWKFRVGDPSGAYMTWDGSKLIKKNAKHKGSSQLGDSDDGASDTDVMTVYGHMQSDDWVSGVTGSGWRISNAGRAVFRNIVARGSIRSSVFEADVVSAVAGTMVIAKSAGKLDVTMSVPGSGTWTMSIEDPPGTGWLFANGDILRIKEVQGSVSETWFTVTRGTQSGGHQTYTCTFQSGTRPASYEKGLGVLDYGQSGQGFLELSADGTGAPYYSVRTHAGSPWTTVTERGRFGNMNGAFGVASNYYGFGIGDYSGGNYLKYDTNGGFTLKGGAGAVTLDANGIGIAQSTTSYLKWTGASNNGLVGIIGATVGSINYLISQASYDSAGHGAAVMALARTSDNTSWIDLMPTDSATLTGVFIAADSQVLSDLPSSLLHLKSTAPTFRMEDTTSSAKSLLLTVDANVASFGEVTGGNFFYLDLANKRVGIGASAPTAAFNVEGATVVNDTGADADFRIEGDTQANLFFLDASADSIGIGTATPAAPVEIALEVGLTSLLIKNNTYISAKSSGGAVKRVFGLSSSDVAYFGGIDSGVDTVYFRTGGTNRVELNSTGRFGYASGMGGTVTQATSKSTGATLNKVCGQITMNNAALAGDTTVSFTLTNSTIAAGDVLILNHISGGTAGSYLLEAQSAAGSATIVVRNITTGSLSEAIVIAFAVIKAVTA